MSDNYSVTLITGDGVGPELAQAAKRCVDTALATTEGAKGIDWTECVAGVDIMESHGTPMPDETIAAVRSADATLKAPITTPIGTGFRSVNVMLRQTLDMYCCLRPCKSYPGVRSKYDNVDIVLVRENCEDLYAGVEFEKGTAANAEIIETVNRLATGKKITTPAETTGVSIKPISVQNTERIVRFAFEYARKHGRKSVTYVHKANIMKHTDGLFKQVAEEVAKDYPDIESWECLIDAMCMQLVQRPEQFDVVVTENLYGDILSDLCAGLVGGLGMAPGANIGDGGATFEATHGSAPKYKGLNKVNPSALILSATLMLDYLGEPIAASRLEAAVAKVIVDGETVTYDMKEDRDDPTAVGTQEMADAICAVLKA
ncbi:MAG: isocitrate/isopropylmalate dehydrogenase family protein [Phycisphaerales bacterium]|jgi:isocitrate dehydrogenase (NAD+)|nr:isocitrate/isopropylmalate dehydrogenase family protein [Phycisphaerales bacterium]MBT7170543.1 isocitrate/isopropylmalate dehydrogenase family protein [Phycisphaerales bacterium]